MGRKVPDRVSITFEAPVELAEQIDEHAHLHEQTRSEAIRQLLRRGLAGQQADRQMLEQLRRAQQAAIDQMTLSG